MFENLKKIRSRRTCVMYWIIVVIVVLGLGILFWNSRVIVPQNHQYVVSFLGRYERILDPGFHLLFPGLFAIDCDVFIGIDSRPLFEKDEKIDFSSSLSAEVEADIHYQIIDSRKYTYAAENSTELLVTEVAKKLRAFLEHREYEKVNSNRQMINLDSICSGNEIDPPNGSHITSVFFSDMENRFGIILISIILKDIKLSQEEEGVRLKKYKAEKEEEVAKIVKRTAQINSEAKAKTIEIEAEARRIALEKEGLGFEAQLGALKRMMSEAEAVEFLKHYEKWRNLSDKAVVINDVDAMNGAKLAAGFNSVPKP